MNFTYETDRLILKILEPSKRHALQILDFYNDNLELFERYEATRAVDFYTPSYQQSVLTYEYRLALQKKCIRFWVYEKNDSQRVAGTVCFYDIKRSIYDCCETGYKFDERYWHRGYAREALSFGVSLMFEELNLHRIKAYVMEENKASIRLLYDLDFQFEGICRKSIRIRGNWEDHMLFARIK